MVGIGDNAPDFELDDQNENTIKLADLKGKRVLLSFHPLGWTGVCAKQMQSLEANYDRFRELNTVALGVSIDHAPAKKAWADSLGIRKTSLLCDFWPHGGVASAYGLFMEDKGFSKRANVIIDESGKIVFYKVYPIGELPDIQEIIDFLSK